MKDLFYYGVERTGEKEMFGILCPFYTKGVYVHRLQEGEDEQQVREQIEKRCCANPDGRMMCGLKTEFFKWLN